MSTPPSHSSPNQAIQLLVLDIDGTIAGSGNEIREPVKAAVSCVLSKGIQVTIATGRMYQSAVRFHRELGCTLPLITYQGALIKDPRTSKVYGHWSVNQSMALRLLDDLERPEFQAISIHCYIEDELYVRQLSRETVDYISRSAVQATVVGDLRSVLQSEPTKLLALCDDSHLIQTLYQFLREKYTPNDLYLTRSVSTFVEATHPAVNKGNAVRYLAEEVVGLTADEVMAVGDNFNDVEMLNYAGIGVAMGDAPDPVKAIAQWVAPDVTKDGVAVAIHRFLLD
ncbi:MAG: HAD family phosphatase [Cyanobacteria bacterium WB6_1B_304]|jgi:Cof subfamily protein (haloacid dehalogenase superfamily)|nr:HAD family phosphatase [Cyanobacteria bacterium WB6_1B_304]